VARTIATTAVGSNRNKGVLMLALLFGILSAALMFAFLNAKGKGDGLDDQLGLTEGAETVVVLTRDVAAGEKITSDMLTTRTIPGGALLPGRVTEIEDVLGKVATTPMFAGEQVIAAKVTTYEGQNTLAYKVPEGMRALSLMVPHEAWIAGGLPQPGDRVDIMGITTLVKTDPLTGEEKPDVVAGIIAQDVEVLAVSQSLVRRVVNTDLKANGEAGSIDPVAASAPGNPGEEPETFQDSVSITLALPIDLAAKVAIIDAMEDSQGQFRILVRQKGDSQAVTGQQTWSLDEVFPAR